MRSHVGAPRRRLLLLQQALASGVGVLVGLGTRGCRGSRRYWVPVSTARSRG